LQNNISSSQDDYKNYIVRLENFPSKNIDLMITSA